MSVEEIKEWIKSLTPAERREVELLLRELDAAEAKVLPPVKVPFDQAVDRVFQKHSEALRKLAQ